MRKILYILFLFNNTISAQLPKVSTGTIRHFENFQSRYVDSRNVDVWLPDGYNASKKYAVLYMHDGQMLFDTAIAWNHQVWDVDGILGKLMKERKIKDCIVVGIWNSGVNRDIDYIPQKPFESLSLVEQDTLLRVKKPDGSPAFSSKVQSDRYLKFLVTELKPFIDKKFSTIRNRDNTLIAGSSKGGLISLYALCEYPQVFGGAACLSTHWTGIYSAENNPIPAAIFKYMQKKLPSPKDHRIYFDYGTATLDTLYEPFQKKADEIMKSKGYNARNWITKKFPDANHSEKAWNSRFHIPMLFLLKKERGKSNR